MSYYIHAEQPHIFIHIPKTAGSSILQVIKQNYDYEIISNNETKYTNYHSSLEHASNFVCPYNSAFYIFTVVRNPWSRVSSWFHFRKEIVRKGLKAINAGKHTKKVVEDYELILNEYNIMNDDFNKWIELYYNSKWDHTWFSLNNTQTAWLQSTKFTVDNVIKFEDINTGIKDVPMFQNKTLPVYNVSPVKYDYTNMYNSASQNLISKIYQEDIDTFKYTFK